MQRKPLIIGHRGASAVAPENTVAAFQSAIEVGADGVEFDVQLSKDNVAVIIHDDNLRRTGSLDRDVAKLTAAELKAVDVGSWFHRHGGSSASASTFMDERVPLLQDLFELYRSNPGILYLEMKCSSVHVTRLAEVCCEMIDSSSLKERIVVESFDLNAIALLKRLDSSIKTAALFEPRLSSPRALLGHGLIEKTLSAGADEIALHHKLATSRLVERAHTAGLAVVVWTVDDPDWLSRGRSMGVDALITNNPAVMLN